MQRSIELQTRGLLRSPAILSLTFVVGVTVLSGVAKAQILDRPIVLRGGRILTMVSPPIEAGTIIIKGGRIDALGADVSAPFLSRTVDVAGKTITPGFIDTRSALGGLDEAAGADPTAKAWDAFDRYARNDFREALRNGVTTVYVGPVGEASILGTGVAVRLVPPSADAGAGEAIADSGALHIDLGSGQRAIDRLKTFQGIRKEFREAVEYRRALEDYEEDLKEYIEKLEARAKEEEKDGKADKKNGKPKPGDGETPDEEAGAAPPSALGRTEGDGKNGDPSGKSGKKNGDDEKKDELKKPQKPAPSRKNDTLLEAVDRKLRVRIDAHRSEDILNALDLAEEFNLDIVLDGATDAYLIANRLAEKDVPVILGPVLHTGAYRNDEYRRHCERNAAMLTKAGVRWTVGSGAATPLASRFIGLNAQLAVGFGAQAEDWLPKVTTDAAAILGLQRSMGSLRRGRSADLVVWSGDPSDPSSVVERVYVAGKLAYLAGGGDAEGGGR